MRRLSPGRWSTPGEAREYRTDLPADSQSAVTMSPASSGGSAADATDLPGVPVLQRWTVRYVRRRDRDSDAATVSAVSEWTGDWMSKPSAWDARRIIAAASRHTLAYCRTRNSRTHGKRRIAVDKREAREWRRWISVSTEVCR